MKVKTVYIAEDGSMFDTESECLKYEETMSQFPDCICFFDKNSMPMNPKSKKECMDAYMESEFMAIFPIGYYQQDIEKAKIDFGIEVPSQVGFYKWNSTKWVKA